LALLGTAIWLLSVLATVTSVSIAGTIAALLALAAAAIWLIKRRPALRSVGVAGLLLLGAATFAAPLVGDTSPDLEAGSATAMFDDVDWRAFDLTAIDAAIAEGKIVFVDVTADWCVTCKVNKRLVLDDEAIMRRLQAPDVVCMRADWTRPDTEIAKFLASYGRYGIPFNVVYGPGARGGLVLPELLDQESILSALDKAG
jgi:suppressor for copper-sensitivity B